MKKIISQTALLVVSVLFTTSSFSQDIEPIKQQTLRVCNLQAEQLEESQQELALKVCECTVESTDYEVFLADLAEGNIAKVQTDAASVAEKCAQDLGAEDLSIE